jgi:transketolase
VSVQASATASTIPFAQQMRIDVVQQIFDAGSGHPGGSLSCVDLLACLFWTRIDRETLLGDRPDRNHFILSKGHAAPALYAALAGIGVIKREELTSLRQLGSRLQGHPDRSRLRAVEMSTGSLGQGLSVAVGLAWQLRHQACKGTTFVLLGDGELDEGQIWEAVGLAAGQRLANLVAIVDLNGIQNDGRVEDILDLRPYPEKFRAFGWRVREIDGQAHDQILAALDWAEIPDGRPAVILARTTKGSGVSFMEDRPEWHSHGLSWEQLVNAVQELEAP